MAALLVGLGVMSVMAAVAMPVWRQAAQREKETELIFRGQQYARAIGLFQRKMGPGALPPSIDVLVQQKYLRKKYTDPITGGEFQPIFSGQSVPGMPGAPGAPGTPQTPQSGPGTQQTSQPGQNLPGRPGSTPSITVGAGTSAGAGIMGVVSKSTGSSIRIYNARTKYNEWTFLFVQQTQAPGAQRPGGPGGPAGGPPGQQGPGAKPPVGTSPLGRPPMTPTAPRPRL